MSAQLNHWTDIQVAYQVARLGTLSAAADFLDVHHSTVLRRIDALEKTLNVRLFHRHPRGYTPTEAGTLLLKVAQQTQTDFERLIGQLQGVDEQISGTLVVTSVESFRSKLIPLLAEFQQQYPDLHIDYVEDSRLYRLEHGEAHVSIRPGAEPKDPDYVVQPLASLPSTLYASESYLRRFGKLKSLQDIQGHRFVGSVRSLMNVPMMAWLQKQVPAEQVVFRTVDFVGLRQAVESGAGIGPLHCWLAQESDKLQPLLEPPENWHTRLWLVTHRDVHRTSKVQLFTKFIKTSLRF